MDYLNIAFAMLLMLWGAAKLLLTIRNAWVVPGRNRSEQFFMSATAIALGSLLLR